MPSWLRLEASFIDHPKVAPLSNQAFRIHIRGLCYCAQHLTDGFIPRIVAGRNERWIQELLDAGLWEEMGQGLGYEIHDYLEYNPSRDELEAQRKKRSVAGRRAAAERWRTDRPQA
jgi:hypothetical protein